MSRVPIVKIMLDADVLIHFVKGGNLALLIALFPNRMVLLDLVYQELTKNNNKVSTQVTNMISTGLIENLPFPKNSAIVKEYAQLIKSKGRGESACLDVCRHQPHIIASSNLSDIRSYCEQHSLAYLTTMDILTIGLHKGKITETDCNSFIQQVRASNSKLPDMDIATYRDKLFDRTKYSY